MALGGGRQTEIGVRTGTAQARIELWSDWLTTFRANPMLGDGMILNQPEAESARREQIRPITWPITPTCRPSPTPVSLAASAFWAHFLSDAMVHSTNRLQGNHHPGSGLGALATLRIWYGDGLRGGHSLAIAQFLRRDVLHSRPGHGVCRICQDVSAAAGSALDVKIILRCCYFGVIYLIGIYVFLQVMKLTGVFSAPQSRSRYGRYLCAGSGLCRFADRELTGKRWFSRAGRGC